MKKQCYGYIIFDEELNSLPDDIPYILVPNAFDKESYIIGLSLIPYIPHECMFEYKYRRQYTPNSDKVEELKSWLKLHKLWDEESMFNAQWWRAC